MNHTYDDLNGISTRISQATTWAAEKGILCVTSAGNSGNSPWHFITAPADADGILAVGAVDNAGNHAAFSGWGPTPDGRTKPEVMALGVQAAYPHADGTIRNGNGTSFSSPLLCGAAACLWQAFPNATAQACPECNPSLFPPLFDTERQHGPWHSRPTEQHSTSSLHRELVFGRRMLHRMNCSCFPTPRQAEPFVGYTAEMKRQQDGAFMI